MDYIGAIITGAFVLFAWAVLIALVVSQGWGILLVVGGVCLGLYCIASMIFNL